jgi:NADH-quinone oxidoreductase subunit E
MTTRKDFSLGLDGSDVVARMQDQTQDWMKTTCEMATCRDFASLIKLQSEFSKRTMERWFAPMVDKPRPATTKPTRSAPVGFKVEVKSRTVNEPAAPAKQAPAAAKAEPKREDMEVVTAIKDHKPATSAPKPAAAPAAATSDDLTSLKGIGPAMARKLEALGIKSLKDVANMSADKIDEVESAIGFKGRVSRDDWQGQAKALLG